MTFTRKLLGTVALMLILILVAALAMALTSYLPNQSLLRNAIPLKMDGTARFGNYPEWLSDHQIILNCSADGYGGKCLYDIAAHTKTPVDALSAKEQKAIEEFYSDKKIKEKLHAAAEQLGYCCYWTWWDHHRNEPLPQPLATKPPADAEIIEVDESPDKKQIVWLLNFKRSSFRHTLLHKLFPNDTTTSLPTISEVWISQSDGSHWQEVGAAPAVGPNLEGGKGPCDLEFSPDSKHLSFFYKDAFWVVPIQGSS